MESHRILEPNTRRLVTLASVGTSAPHLLNVLLPAGGEYRLPAPAVDEASGNSLDLGDFTGNPNATVDPWPLIAVGQTVWLRITGILGNGGTDTITLLDGVPVTAAMISGVVWKAIPRSRLEALSDNSTITVECKVNFSGGAEAGAITFPGRSYTLRQKNVPPFLLDPSTMRLVIGETRQRTPTGGVTPYSYVSMPTSIATVNATTGFVVAIRAGSATVTATDSGNPVASGTYAVVVAAPPVDFGSAHTLNCTGYVVAEGRPPRIPPGMATYTRVATGGAPPYTYSSSNPTVASIDQRGNVVAGANGTTTLTARDSNGTTGSYVLTVYGAKVWRHRPAWGLMQYAEQTGVFGREPDLERCPLNRDEIRAFVAVYLPEGPAVSETLGWNNNYYWTSEFHPTNNFYWVKGLAEGWETGTRYSDKCALMALVR